MKKFEEWVQENHPEVFTEKWKKDVDIKQTGDHEDKNIAQLKKELSGLKGKGGEHAKSERGERLFAIRAKSGWKKGKGAVKGKKKKMGAGQGKQRRLKATKYE